MVGMNTYPRIYSEILREHLAHNRQMAFVSGPRQVGKTTVCRGISSAYINWDDQDLREQILKGPAEVAQMAGLQKMQAEKPVLVFDELNRYPRWKTFLKGFFDVYGPFAKIMVTGSSRLDVFKRGGDSLMGRYFLYRMHPFSVAELAAPVLRKTTCGPPHPLSEVEWAALWTYGGYPEPFVRRDPRFSRRWHNLRQTQLLREDVREMTRIQELDQLIALSAVLHERSGDQVVYAALAKQVRVSENTARGWLGALAALHVGFVVKPWHRNVAQAIRKEPKWFLRDWSMIQDVGKRAETFVACQLLKAVEGWTDLGFGHFDLFHIRDKQKREVDFLVTRDNRPWFLVEAKNAETHLTPALAIMQKQTGASHAFQVVIEEPYVESDCFRHTTPIVVPARTFLSQLL
jgi:predicted AAA+ superfamily ATPase